MTDDREEIVDRLTFRVMLPKKYSSALIHSPSQPGKERSDASLALQ